MKLIRKLYNNIMLRIMRFRVKIITKNARYDIISSNNVKYLVVDVEVKK